MQKMLLFFALIFFTLASAAFEPRCGTDAFGNEVCLDKDGVLIRAPESAAEAGASGVSAAAPVATRDEAKARARCGIDPFGNTVCGQ